MTVVGACGFGDCLAVGYAHLLERDGKFLVVLNTPFQCAQMEFSLTLDECLLELLALLDHPSGILLVHACQDGRQFLTVAFCHRLDGADILWRRVFDEIKLILTSFLVERISCAHVFQFDSCAYVACLKCIDRIAELSAYREDLGETLLSSARGVLKIDSGFKSAAHHFEI